MSSSSSTGSIGAPSSASTICTTRPARCPRFLFTHDNYVRDYTGHGDSKADFYDKKVILLARDPRDVAVSQFFQWKYRMKPNKKDINAYPLEDLAPFDFVMSEAGLPKVIDFMNLWSREAPRIKDF